MKLETTKPYQSQGTGKKKNFWPTQYNCSYHTIHSLKLHFHPVSVNTALTNSFVALQKSCTRPKKKAPNHLSTNSKVEQYPHLLYQCLPFPIKGGEGNTSMIHNKASSVLLPIKVPSQNTEVSKIMNSKDTEQQNQQ